MPTKCCFLQIETYMLLKTITPEILAMPQSRNCSELLGTFSECLPFFYDNHNHNIFHFLYSFFCFSIKGWLATQSSRPPSTKSASKPAKIFEADAKLPIGIYGIEINMLAIFPEK